MRVRIIRVFSPILCHDVLCVQQWMNKEAIHDYMARHRRPDQHDSLPDPDECWEPVKDFGIDEYDKASAFAMDLSMEKKPLTEMAVFENGLHMRPALKGCDPNSGDHSYNPARPLLYTKRQYPCGCCAQGYGDVPAYCGTHGSPTNCATAAAGVPLAPIGHVRTS